MRTGLLRIIVVLIALMGGKLCAYFGDEKCCRMDCGLPNLSDRPTIQDKNIDIFANALYWYTSETIDWAFTLASHDNFEQTSYKTITFNWDSGFRVGVGYNMHHDDWDTQIAYTWFQAQARDHASGAVTSAFLAARLSLLEPFQTGKISFNLHYNMFDWDLGRSFFVSESLSLRPFIGAKAGWINQKIHAVWTIPNFLGFGGLYSATENVKNNFRGGGPKGGVNGKWILGCREKHVFSIIGNFAAAYMWGHWVLRDEFIDVFFTQTSIPMKNRNFGALMLQALMGLGWDFNFDNNRSHCSLKVGYEIQDWLNHFQVFTDASGTQNSDLILQGLTCDLRFDF